MSQSFLNTKSFHPRTLANQKKVFEAEQHDQRNQAKVRAAEKEFERSREALVESEMAKSGSRGMTESQQLKTGELSFLYAAPPGMEALQKPKDSSSSPSGKVENKRTVSDFSAVADRARAAESRYEVLHKGAAHRNSERGRKAERELQGSKDRSRKARSSTRGRRRGRSSSKSQWENRRSIARRPRKKSSDRRTIQSRSHCRHRSQARSSRPSSRSSRKKRNRSSDRDRPSRKKRSRSHTERRHKHRHESKKTLRTYLEGDGPSKSSAPDVVQAKQTEGEPSEDVLPGQQVTKSLEQQGFELTRTAIRATGDWHNVESTDVNNQLVMEEEDSVAIAELENMSESEKLALLKRLEKDKRRKKNKKRHKRKTRERGRSR